MSEDKANSEDTELAARNRARRQLLTIMGIALVSLGGSYLLFYLASSGGGWGTTNNGTFVQPQTTVRDLGWSGGAEERNWWLWVVDDSACQLDCQQMVKDIRALHILIGREASRVRRGVLLRNGAVPALDEAFPKLVRLEMPGRGQLERGVYIVDPNGNLVFHYSMDMDPKLVLQDLKKMLKVSQIG